MYQSHYFVKTLREPPKNEVSINAKLLEQACYIQKLMAGVYTYLPLGLRVLNNINAIIREEINNIGGQEIYMPAMQPKELWDKTNRWEELSNIMYQFKDKSDHLIGLATTHEETITSIIKDRINSYKDLPFYLYQIQDKFRNEPRAKSGLIRGREFAMKDLYSFHQDEEDLDEYYKKSMKAYFNIFSRVGLKSIMIEASGGAFTKQYSHEFQVLSEAGEDRIIYCPKYDFAQNIEISKFKEEDKCPKCGRLLKFSKGIEVGNIFKLGTRFSQAFGAYYLDKTGKKQPIVMASYGIGPGRLMGAIIEVHHDNNGIIWPPGVTPFKVHLIDLCKQKNNPLAKKTYHACQENNFDILYDERDVSPGIKLKDADLIGISVRLIISDKNKDKIELTYRDTKETSHHSLVSVLKELKKYYK
ncbi:hypothetical protein KKF61_02150 [Patescibacteria group bacterium]|nr:hypothetical protein [Patescibacteria group bacterium]MBU0963658.1 hypothetical protein [Patescibacteria group bacterium]